MESVPSGKVNHNFDIYLLVARFLPRMRASQLTNFDFLFSIDRNSPATARPGTGPAAIPTGSYTHHFRQTRP